MEAFIALGDHRSGFYGLLSVREYVKSGYRYLSLESGAINHGGQFLDPDKRSIPTEYYDPKSGVGIAIQNYHEGSTGVFGSSGGIKV